ncbi:ATP synthase [Acidobacteria bacterium Mor1]|nr:ATP synthase [Acidobacteria bacterium Mor1]
MLAPALKRAAEIQPYRATGTVSRVVGLSVESDGPPCSVGEECLLLDTQGKVLSRSQVVGFSGSRVISMPIDRLHGLAVGSKVVALGRQPTLCVGDGMLGRVLDADGQPLDEGPPVETDVRYPLDCLAPPALSRQRISEPFVSGVRVIDGMLSMGVGQRIGIMAGSGVGKSTLLGMIARHAKADVAVIALVGERGREVRDFIEEDLSRQGLEHTVVFVATSDEPPLRRIRAALAATATAEYFRDQGKRVVLLMDSITRVAMAQREVGLSMGEPPSSKGYPPSVFSLLPQLVERAGAVRDGGSITGLYSVYVEGDDMNEPIADAARSLLDGHIVLTRDLASKGHYPAIDVLDSISRLMPQVSEPDQLTHSRELRQRLAAHRDAEDMILVGAYHAGSNPKVDAALRSWEPMIGFLTQEKQHGASLEETRAALAAAALAGEESV